jgi:serine/threonine protein kinase
MHNMHVVHRDIKPANCMYSIKKNRFVLVDLGMSHPVKERCKNCT